MPIFKNQSSYKRKRKRKKDKEKTKYNVSNFEQARQ